MIGAVLGVSGGLAPGPMTVLVLVQTLRFGFGEGLKVALTPVLTDGPLLIASALLVGALSGLDMALAAISVAGAVFLLLLAREAWGAELPTADDADIGGHGSVRKALLTNLFNPHPYVFWVAVGGPLVHEAATSSTPISSVGGFLLGFFGGLCGSKVLLAWALARVRHRVSPAAYQWTMRVLALVLVVFAGGFVAQAVGRLGG